MVFYDKDEEVLKRFFKNQKKDQFDRDKSFTQKVMRNLPDENLFLRVFILSLSLLSAFLIIIFNYDFNLPYERVSNFLSIEKDFINLFSQQPFSFYFLSTCIIGLFGYYTFWVIKKV